MPQNEHIFNVVVGTAGHIDHGKSSLVQALTGIHPDRLKEEQERGITIDLGFAPLQLSSGLRVGIIDVPGHERFIKNMIAGAAGIDFVMLVVAADDGVMAQTREHLHIIELLGVRDGLVVITKTDLVTPDYLALAADNIKTLLAGTMLENKPLLTVSCKTGAGIPELKAALEQRLAGLARRPTEGPFRMSVQRVFAKEGFGVVVTGVPESGRIGRGDTVEILPPGYQGRVKGLNAYGRVIERAQAGHSTALNLHGPQLDKTTLKRGMVAATPGVFKPAQWLTARLWHLPGAPRPLKHRAPVRFHAGTAEIQGQVLLLEGDTLAPGSWGWVQLLLAAPAVVATGDRFILRHQTPMVTLGGGRIVDSCAKKLKRRQPDVITKLERRLAVLEQPCELLADVLNVASAPLPIAELSVQTGLLPEQLLPLLKGLEHDGRAVELKSGALFAAPASLAALRNMVLECVVQYLKDHPALNGIELPELRRRVELHAGAAAAACVDQILTRLKQENAVRVECNQVFLSGHERKLEGAWAAQALQIENTFLAGALAPPSPEAAAATVKVPPQTFRDIVKYLRETGRLVEIAPGLYFHATPVAAAAEELRRLFSVQPECTVSEIRQRLNMTRKFIVPLMEYFDRQGLTERLGDKRRLAGKWE